MGSEYAPELVMAEPANNAVSTGGCRGGTSSCGFRLFMRG